MGPERIQAHSIICCKCTRKETIMARLPIPGQDADNWGTLINEFLRVAHNENGTLRLGLDEVDATKIGVVAENSQKAKANSLAINQFLANPQVDGVSVPPRLVLPSGTIYIDDTINMINQVNVRNSLSLRGRGTGATVLRKMTNGCLIELAGYFNYVGDMTLSGFGPDNISQKALCGLYVQGLDGNKPDPRYSVNTRLNTFR